MIEMFAREYLTSLPTDGVLQELESIRAKSFRFLFRNPKIFPTIPQNSIISPVRENFIRADFLSYPILPVEAAEEVRT